MGLFVDNEVVIVWVQCEVFDLIVVFFVCIGVFILECVGFLCGKKVIIFYNVIVFLWEKVIEIEVLENICWVDNGKIIIIAGVLVGIDGVLYLVGCFCGIEVVQVIVYYMEYDKW